MLQSLITYGYLYSKELSADKAPTVLQPLDEVLEIPEAEALWGTKKKDEKEAEAEVVAEVKVVDEEEEEVDDDEDEEAMDSDSREISKEEAEENRKLMELFDVIPLEPASQNWDTGLPVTVIDLPIEHVYDCFWADEAPYLLPSVLRKGHDYIVNWTLWADADAEAREIFGPTVNSVRKFEKRIPSSHTDRLYTPPIQIMHVALMSQDETSFTIMIKETYVGSPYAGAHQTWYKWEFVTDAVDSNKTAVRQQASVQWGENGATKPWVVWRVLEKWQIADIKTYNEQIAAILPEAANRFSHGPPLYDTTTPTLEPVEIDVIQEGRTSG